ncbi:gliding motility-associated C-terminal domain-containing protein, partial [bacterium]|nr:gliding motility-associated C-terminal domain-containing protein [bacterium]
PIHAQETWVEFGDIYTTQCSLMNVEVCVEDSLGYVPALSPGLFHLWENGSLIPNSSVELITECIIDADIVLLLDISRSMDIHVDSLRAKIPEFVAGLSNVNFRIAMVMFDGCNAELAGIRNVVRTDFESACTYDSNGADYWSTDSAQFSCLFEASEYFTEGSSTEDPYGALLYAAHQLDFRPEVKKIFLLFTDERPEVNRYLCHPALDYSPEALETIIDSMNVYGIRVMPVTPHSGSFLGSGSAAYYEGYYELGPATGGTWFHLYDPFDDIVDSITAAIAKDTCCYTLAYYSTNNCAGILPIYVEVDSYGNAADSFQSSCPPIAEYVIPSICGGVTTCEDQSVVIAIQTRGAEIIRDSAVLNVGGTEYGFDSPEITWLDGDTIIFSPSVSWEHYDTVHIILNNAVDVNGCTAELPSCYFIVDSEPPVFMDPFPSESDIYEGTILTPHITVLDSPAGVDTILTDPVHSTVTINGDIQSGYSLQWNGDILEFHGIVFNRGDIVEICLYSVCDDPDMDYCEPNCSSFCWEFEISAAGLQASSLVPVNNAHSACDDQEIIFLLAADLDVIPDSIYIEINGIEYTFDSPYLDFRSDSVIFSPPPGFWEDGEIIVAEVTNAADVRGNTLENSDILTFLIDLSPPVAEFLEPGNGSISKIKPEILISVEDLYSGVNLDSLILTVGGHIFRIPYFDWNITQGLLSFSSEAAGIAFPQGDTITVALRFCDTPDYCFPNCADSTWTILIAPKEECHAIPNPFTPNGDRFNPVTEFSYPGMYFEEAELGIYNLEGNQVYITNLPPKAETEMIAYTWNGTDNSGKPVKQGVYIYIIKIDGKVVCNGSVTVVR